MDPVAGSKRRPMAAVRRLRLFSREIKERISLAGLELLLSRAQKITEGQVAAEGHYYGSTLLTLDLTQRQAEIKDPCDVATTTRLAALLEQEQDILTLIRTLAATEAQQVAGCPLQEIETEIRIRCDQCRIFIDIDVEGQTPMRTARHC